MSEKIIDLDALVPADKIVRFGGDDYRVPGDMPLVTFLKVQHVEQMQGDEGANLQAIVDGMIDAVVGLLAWYLPEHDNEKRAKLRTKLGSTSLSGLVNFIGEIYPAEDEPDEPEADEVPPAGGATTPTTT